MKNISIFLRTLLAFSCLAAISGCSATKSEDSPPTNPKDLFESGISDINQGNYKTASEAFETLEKEHPASDLAPEAQVRRAYSQYLEGKLEDAISTTEDFIKQYPAHNSVAYMYYLKALCYYDRIVDPERDQQLTNKALEALNEVIARFPDTQYARDAKLKAEFAFNHLAAKEMEIASYYQRKNNLVAALNRYKVVIEQYQTSIFTPEALYRLVEVFYTIGDEDQAKKYAAVLGHNYPDSDWYDKAYSLVTDNAKKPRS